MADSDKSRRKLSDSQHIAIQKLLAGATDIEAAKAAGVERQTVNHWKHNDPAFSQELIRQRAEIWEDTRNQLKGMVLNALSTISKAVNEGDTKAAMWLLDKINLDEIATEEINELKNAKNQIIDEEKEKEKYEFEKRVKRMVDKAFVKKYGNTYHELIHPSCPRFDDCSKGLLEIEYNDAIDQAKTYLKHS
jgi:hypothetical protein